MTGPAVSKAPAESFAELSAALTGFRTAEIWGTGQVDPYLSELIAMLGEDMVAHLLVTGQEALAARNPNKELKELVLEDPDLGPVARSVIVLWYTGQWNPLPSDWRNRNGASPLDVARVISAASYKSGLVWPAIGAHTKGANPTGYGSWANPPTAVAG